LAAPPIELERFLPYRLSVLANLTSSTIAGAYEQRFDLSIPEWRVIAVLSRYPGLSAREVAQKSRMDAVAVSRAVNRLLRAGRLRRTVAASDRRRSVLHVSRSGAAVYRQVAPLALRFERALLASFTAADQAQLNRILGQLQARAEALADEMRNGHQEARAPGPRPAKPRRGSTA
jgi:DNA-binding MarR family transcriptional regulator